MMTYRKEIDGLRAVAVVPVVLFHAGISLFAGGFVGVDVFFVISGYLITSLIISELDQGKFSLVRFYERRARRILPALFVVMLTCFVFAGLWLLPVDMKDFAQSALAVSLYVSNFLFWRESGYFETSSEFKPLLHTWSLAVEEQFYVIVPLTMMLAWRVARKNWVVFLGLGALASFALAQWSSVNNPAANFFLLPTRAWELALGSLSAHFLARPGGVDRFRPYGQILSVLGLLLIVYSVFAYDRSTPFPGVYALAPTVGTMLIVLFGNETTWIGRILGNSVFVGIGLLSYSLYLWHQPLFSFARHRLVGEPGLSVLLMLSLVAFGLAYLTWRYVEQPFRRNPLVTRNVVFSTAAAGSLIFVALGAAGHLTEGQYFQSPDAARMRAFERRLVRGYGLHQDCDAGKRQPEQCATSDKPEVLLWGDSNAMHLMPALLASKPDLRMAQMTLPKCGPILGIAPNSIEEPKSFVQACLDRNDAAIQWLKQNPSVRHVVLSSRLGQYSHVVTRDGREINGRLVALEYLKSTMKQLKSMGLNVAFVSPMPQDERDIGRCLLRAEMYGADRSVCNLDGNDPFPTLHPAVDMLKSLAKDNKVIWLSDALCRQGVCYASANDVLIYRDRGHLSYEGSVYVGKALDLYATITKTAVN